MTERILTLLAFFLFQAIQLCSQGASTFIVMNVSGNVSYAERPGAGQRGLLPGQTLETEAVLYLSSGASVRLLHDGNSYSLTEAGNYPVRSLAGKRSATSTSFLKRFVSYVYDGIINTSGPDEIEKYHEKYLTSSSGGVKGFAGGEYGIAINSPVTGNVPAGLVEFGWFSAGDSAIYDFQIADFQTEGLIFKALLRDTVFEADLGKLALEPSRKYYWVVQKKQLGEMAIGFSLADDPSLRSPKTEFIVKDPGKKEELVRSLENEPGFLEAGAVDQMLMTAHALEENRYMYEAGQVLGKAREQSHGDPVVDRIYGAFLVRQGLWHAAQKIFPNH